EVLPKVLWILCLLLGVLPGQHETMFRSLAQQQIQIQQSIGTMNRQFLELITRLPVVSTNQALSPLPHAQVVSTPAQGCNPVRKVLRIQNQMPSPVSSPRRRISRNQNPPSLSHVSLGHSPGTWRIVFAEPNNRNSTQEGYPPVVST
ncbi:hypothetical protein GOODEAATRI_024797, partial [Goodea atripinnis]